MAKSKKTASHFTFAGTAAKVVEVQPTDRDLILLRHSPEQALAVAWDIDAHGYGFWRIQQIGIIDGEVVTKALRKGEVGAAFYGEVSVVGAGANDLYTSDGFEDDDIVDSAENVTNKVREVRVYPKRST